MVRRKSSDKEIAMALAFFKSIRKQAPAQNQIIIDLLDELERRLHDELYRSVIQELESTKED